MARSPIGDNEADRPIRSREEDCNRVSTVACEEVLHRSGSSKPASDDESRWFRAVVCLVVLVIGVIVIFQIYRIRRHDLLSAQAIDLGKTFIHSSPVVEEDLGTVKAVKETGEEHRTGPAPGWYVDFDVLGKRKSGVVEMRLRKANDEWYVPSAKLKIGHTEVVSLR
jgi:hypothetical protein